MGKLIRQACFLFLAAGGVHAADEISVESSRRGDALEVTCRALLQAPVGLVWQTLTDYNRLAEFIPGMRRSRLVERRGAVATVEQSGEVSFLFVSFPIDVTLEIMERPPQSIEAKLLKGNLKQLDGAYRVELQGDGRVLLSWKGVIEPAEPLLPLIGEFLMRSSIEDQFRGMVAEIDRRSRLSK